MASNEINDDVKSTTTAKPKYFGFLQKIKMKNKHKALAETTKKSEESSILHYLQASIDIMIRLVTIIKILEEKTIIEALSVQALKTITS